MKQDKHKSCLFYFLIVLLGFSLPVAQAETLTGSLPTGLLEVEFYKHPVYLFVPEQYAEKTFRDFPLIIAMPDFGEEPSDYIQEWTSVARRRSFIVIVPAVRPREDTVPYPVDEWILGIKKDVTERYRIAKDRIFLVGHGHAASYAAYLGVKFPQEFSGVALLDGSWAGPFHQLVRLQSTPDRQIPFYVVFSPAKAGLLAKTKQETSKLVDKGYPIYFETIDSQSEFSSRDFQFQMFDWLEEKSRAWQNVQNETELPLKEKVYRWFEEQIKIG